MSIGLSTLSRFPVRAELLRCKACYLVSTARSSLGMTAPSSTLHCIQQPAVSFKAKLHYGEASCLLRSSPQRTVRTCPWGSAVPCQSCSLQTVTRQSRQLTTKRNARCSSTTLIENAPTEQQAESAATPAFHRRTTVKDIKVRLGRRYSLVPYARSAVS